MNGATKPPPQNQKLKLRCLAAISSLVGGGGRSFKLRAMVDDSIGDSIKFWIPCCRLEVVVVVVVVMKGDDTVTSTATGTIGANPVTTDKMVIMERTHRKENERDDIVIGP